jgi:ankyrin repeat protein
MIKNTKLDLKRIIDEKNIEKINLFLLDKNKENYYNFALLYCIDQGYKEMVISLLNNNNFSPTQLGLQTAAGTGRIDILQLILKNKRIYFNNEGSHSFYYAAKNNYTDILSILLEDKRFDPSINKNEALVEAYNKGYSDSVSILFKNNLVRKQLKYYNETLYNKILMKTKIEQF